MTCDFWGIRYICIYAVHFLVAIIESTPSEVSHHIHIAPTKWWLGDCFPFGNANFQGRTISFRQGIYCSPTAVLLRGLFLWNDESLGESWTECLCGCHRGWGLDCGDLTYGVVAPVLFYKGMIYRSRASEAPPKWQRKQGKHLVLTIQVDSLRWRRPISG